MMKKILPFYQILAISLLLFKSEIGSSQITFNFSDSLFYTHDQIEKKFPSYHKITENIDGVNKNKIDSVQTKILENKHIYIDPCSEDFTFSLVQDSTPEQICIGKNEINTINTYYDAEETLYNHYKELSNCKDQVCVEPIKITPLPYSEVKILMEKLNSVSKISMPYNRQVQNNIDYFTFKDPNYIQMILNREYKYTKIFEEALIRHNLPVELKYLVIVESGMNPKAVSRSGAAGLWQFIPSTGRLFSLNIDKYKDERMDPYKSTEAAALYLKELYTTFNDWHLALAAYNCGPGAVGRAMKKHKGKDFWALYPYLPRETKGYVPSFIAFNFLVNYSHHYGICADSVEIPYEFETILVNKMTNLNKLADLAGVDEKELICFNPELKTHIVPGTCEKPYSLKIPHKLSKRLIHSNTSLLLTMSEIIQPIDSSIALNSSINEDTLVLYNHEVRPGDVMFQIAYKYGVEVASIIQWNQLENDFIQPGQHLIIWKKEKKNKSELLYASSKKFYEHKAGTSKRNSRKGKVHEVAPGDTLWSIANKYDGVSIDQIKQLNRLKGNNIKPGQKLVIR